MTTARMSRSRAVCPTSSRSTSSSASSFATRPTSGRYAPAGCLVRLHDAKVDSLAPLLLLTSPPNSRPRLLATLASSRSTPSVGSRTSAGPLRTARFTRRRMAASGRLSFATPTRFRPSTSSARPGGRPTSRPTLSARPRSTSGRPRPATSTSRSMAFVPPSMLGTPACTLISTDGPSYCASVLFRASSSSAAATRASSRPTLPLAARPSATRQPRSFFRPASTTRTRSSFFTARRAATRPLRSSLPALAALRSRAASRARPTLQPGTSCVALSSEHHRYRVTSRR
jgi:hypothetical protein